MSMDPSRIALLVALAGIVLAAGSAVAMRAAGATPGLARRLAGPREMKVGTLFDAGELPTRPVRLVGRVRCADPLIGAHDERLVAFHRDVEARTAAGWRSVERVRETRSFELWDHDGSLTVDPADAAEPLVVIPKVWRGDPEQLEEPHASAVQRLSDRQGPVRGARAITRSISVTDRLLVLAQPVDAGGGRVRLEPPSGGFVITNMALPDAMRLLGGRHRRLMAGAVIGLAAGVLLVAVGLLAAGVALLIGG